MEKEQDIFKNKENLLKPILKPPKELLDYIQYGIDPVVKGPHSPGKYWMEIKLPTFSDGGGYAHVYLAIFSSLEEFFRLTFDEERKLSGQVLGNAFGEVLENAAYHGNKFDERKSIILGCWYGKEGVLFGIRDEGDFYSKKSTKEKIESRIDFPSTTRKDGKEGCNFGLDLMFEAADKIFVDTNQNTIFLALSKKKFIIKKTL